MSVTLSDEQVAGFLKRVETLQEAYADEGRKDWFDADDEARQVCWDLQHLLSGHTANALALEVPVTGGALLVRQYPDEGYHEVEVNFRRAADGCVSPVALVGESPNDSLHVYAWDGDHEDVCYTGHYDADGRWARSA